MTARLIDVNADLGEGCADDDQLLEIVTSANVACGFHAGDRETMVKVCAAAARRGVVIGAHVGYLDREGFGRQPLDVPAAELRTQTAQQIAALFEAAAVSGAQVRFVKPHGALYHRCTSDADAARAVIGAASDAGLRAVLGLPGSALLAEAASAGLDAVAEGFADRGYVSATELAVRGSAGAVLDADDATRQAVRLASEAKVETAAGDVLAVEVRSICVHGDTPSAVVIARAVRAGLEAGGLRLAAFA